MLATGIRSQVGIKSIPGAKGDDIIRVSRQNNSGTYVYFREAVLGEQRDYELGSRDMHGSKDVVDLVYATEGTKGDAAISAIKAMTKEPDEPV